MYFSSHTKVASMMKQALIPELIRLGYTDVPGTPRLVMKKRSPEELQKIEEKAHKTIRGPQVKAERFLNRQLNKVPMSSSAKRKTRLGYKMIARHPDTGLQYLFTASTGIPAPPGTSQAYIVGKHSLVKPKSPVVQRARKREIDEAKRVLQDIGEDVSPKDLSRSIRQTTGEASHQFGQQLKRLSKAIKKLK